MTCEYTNIGTNNFVLDWKRTSESISQTIWQYHGTKSSSVSNEALPGFESKFEYINQTFHDESHKIRLLHAGKNDEGLYWCFIQVIGVSSGTSTQKQLVVGE